MDKEKRVNNKKDIIMTFIIIFLVMYSFVITHDYKQCRKSYKMLNDLSIKQSYQYDLKCREMEDLKYKIYRQQYK